jgi:hypothetical protein
MNVIGVPVEFLQKISDNLGIHLQIQRIEDGDVKLRIWPVTGNNEWRAQTLAGRFKTGLCFHVQHYWMARIFHAYPDAIIQTYYTRWNLTLFEAGAVPWTKNEIASRGMSQTCACTPEMEVMTLVTPSMLDELGGRKVNGIQRQPKGQIPKGKKRAGNEHKSSRRVNGSKARA